MWVKTIGKDICLFKMPIEGILNKNILEIIYPYHSDYLWLTVPDHADWLYKTGEQAKVKVSFYKYGIPCDGEVKYEIGNDLLEADKQGSFKLKNGRISSLQ